VPCLLGTLAVTSCPLGVLAGDVPMRCFGIRGTGGAVSGSCLAVEVTWRGPSALSVQGSAGCSAWPEPVAPT